MYLYLEYCSFFVRKISDFQSWSMSSRNRNATDIGNFGKGGKKMEYFHSKEILLIWESPEMEGIWLHLKDTHRNSMFQWRNHVQSGINSASLQDYGKKNQRINRIQIELLGIILTQHCCPPTGTGIVNSAWRNKLQCYRSANIYHYICKKL